MGIDFQVDLSDEAKRIVNKMLLSKVFFRDFMNQLSYRLGKEAVEYMRPMTEGKSAFYRGNGALAKSLKFDSNVTSDGFVVTFDGLWYGNLMDVGNWSPNTAYYRINRKPWTVGARTANGDQSQITYVKAIHGMGHTTPEVPTHFSEKTAKWLAENMHDFADSYLTEFLRELVV